MKDLEKLLLDMKIVDRLLHAERSCVDDLRRQGFKVVLHQDTSEGIVWILSTTVGYDDCRIGRDLAEVVLRGVGRTDEQALNQIRAQWAYMGDRREHRDHRYECPANTNYGKNVPTGECTCGAEKPVIVKGD